MNDIAVRKARSKSWLIRTLILMFSLVGCANPGNTIGRSINLRPLFFYEPSKQGAEYRINALGPLFDLHRDHGRLSLGLRPLFFYRGVAEPKSWELDYLYPLGLCRFNEAGDRSTRLIPIFRWDDYKGVKEERGEQRLEFLTLFWGRTRQGKDYGGLFPLGGRMSQRLNQDRIRFFLWPIYWDTLKDEATTHHILWPLFSFTHGGGQKGSKFLPLYSYNEKLKDHALDLALLWPLFTMHKDDQNYKWMLFPLVARSESPRTRTTWVLWPFFSHSVYEFGEQWNFPWPFLNINRGSDRQRIKLFPFFKTEQAAGERSSFFLWPLYQFNEFQYPDGWERHHRILLFNGLHIDQRKQGLRKEINFWPFFRYVQERDGSHRLSIPVLFPLEDEGLERNYAPLITLFHRRQQADGTGGWDFLWGLASYKKYENSSLFELSFLYKYMRKGNEVDHSFLGGLIHLPGNISSRPPLNQPEKMR